MGLYFYAAPIDTSLDATICKGLKDGSYLGDGANISFAGAIHGRAFRCAPNNNDVGFGAINWSGCRNFPITNDRSFVIRFKPVFNSVPAAAITLFSLQGTGIYPKCNSLAFHIWPDGHLRTTVYGSNTLGTEQLNITSSPLTFVKHQSYDIVVTWNSIAGSGFNVYLDGTKIVNNFGIGRSFESVTQHGLVGHITLGQGGLFINSGGVLVEEFAIYDSIVDATTFTGTSRTTPIATEKVESISWPLPRHVFADTPSWREYGEEVLGTASQPLTSTFVPEESVELGFEYTFEDVDYVGELKPAISASTIRGFLNYILDFIGAPSLNDDEWATIDDLENPDKEWNVETYDALASVLMGRASADADLISLEHVFLSKGVLISPIADDSSGILLGGETETLEITSGQTNIFLGGVIED